MFSRIIYYAEKFYRIIYHPKKIFSGSDIQKKSTGSYTIEKKCAGSRTTQKNLEYHILSTKTLQDKILSRENLQDHIPPRVNIFRIIDNLKIFSRIIYYAEKFYRIIYHPKKKSPGSDIIQKKSPGSYALQRESPEEFTTLLQQDKWIMGLLQSWFSYYSEFMVAVQGKYDYDAVNDFINAWNNFLTECIDSKFLSTSEIITVISSAVRNFSVNDAAVSKINDILDLVVITPRSVNMLLQNIHKLNPAVFETAMQILRITLQICISTNVGANTVAGVTQLLEGSANTSSGIMGEGIPNGIFGYLVLALDIASLYFTSKEALNGSATEQANRIRLVKDQLQKEIN